MSSLYLPDHHFSADAGSPLADNHLRSQRLVPGNRSMPRRACFLLSAIFLLSLAVLTPAQIDQVELVAPTRPLTPAEEKKAFHLPPGFDVELVAAEPDIAKPLNIAFDDRGRLWVSDTVEYPFAAPPGRKPRDS